jgi:hypothetical protein
MASTGAKASPKARKFSLPSLRARREARFSPKNILRYPRLDTILMVEDAIKDADDYMTKTEIWRSLKKKVMYQTFSIIMDYLEHSGKILIDQKDRKIEWIWDPEGVAYFHKHPELRAR